jgi:uncharacterized protein YgbK (DUF1537 family)
MNALLGVIADDFTGATDVAGMLVKSGMRTVQMIGVPSSTVSFDADAIVIALKSRTVPVADAVRDSLAALAFLQAAGCRQFYFKYCSTFDSTPRGNIGPVAEALLDALKSDFTIACPAFPANGRTIFQGHLFVGDVLLSESGMRDHPLTPMSDAKLVRVLAPQVKHPVGLVNYQTVAKGADAIAARFASLRAEGVRFAIVDALDDDHLLAIGKACRDQVLVTAGSGLAMGLPQNFIADGSLRRAQRADSFDTPAGLRAVISGSCSTATQRQVAVMSAQHPVFRVDALQLAEGVDVVGQALDWAGSRVEHGPVLVAATASSDQVKATQQQLGVERAGELVERALAHIARGLVSLGVRQLVVAGGETSGAVVQALGVRSLRIGPEIDPGVPWTLTVDSQDAPALALALKSGNFGSDDFFLKAWSRLP